jgi:SAM-dependent methyltransferase
MPARDRPTSRIRSGVNRPRNEEGGARDWYREGPASYYRDHGATYANPHAPIVAECLSEAIVRWKLDLSCVLDLACGAGEVTVAIRDRCGSVAGIDPFTHEAYTRATGLPCELMSFEAISTGSLRGRSFSLVVCSFAMHLCPASRLPALVMELAEVTAGLLILTPHKKPVLKPVWGFAAKGELLHRRVRARLYEREAGA